MSDTKKVLELIKDNDVKYIDFRFTDPRGKWHHTAQHVSTVDEEMLTEGIMFDGSSIAGWKAINESDMTLKPDLSTAVMDPFTAQPQLILISDVLDPSTGQPYSRDPRSIAKRAETYLKQSKIGDKAYFGPEAEFFVFDDVRFKTDMHEGYYHLDSEDSPHNSGKAYPEG
ncbi:MAG: glutamine synthetase beta-grasp domain-containing protein, partial [Alphaproteobacteria bacterium]|nr:glutamine synthetase beta-grasp domain-containing protein [Alphaproteobacteria bacterium]